MQDIVSTFVMSKDDIEVEESSYILYLLSLGVTHPSKPEVCYMCKTTTSPLWRWDLKMSDGIAKQMCNACGIREARKREGRKCGHSARKRSKPAHAALAWKTCEENDEYVDIVY